MGSETMSLQGSQNGMELEKGFSGHCSMMINATTALITGGFTESWSKETYFVDIHNWKWTKGPELPVKMGYFPLVSTSQGIMAVGGRDNTNRRYKDEILILKCQDGQDPTICQWQEYPKKLDVARRGHVVIPLPASHEICNN